MVDHRDTNRERRIFSGVIALWGSGIGALLLGRRKSPSIPQLTEEVARPVWPPSVQTSVSLNVRPNPDSVKRHG
jgi:hypothetical protein